MVVWVLTFKHSSIVDTSILLWRRNGVTEHVLFFTVIIFLKTILHIVRTVKVKLYDVSAKGKQFSWLFPCSCHVCMFKAVHDKYTLWITTICHPDRCRKVGHLWEANTLPCHIWYFEHLDVDTRQSARYTPAERITEQNRKKQKTKSNEWQSYKALTVTF